MASANRNPASPLMPRSPSLQNISAGKVRSPLGRPLPLRKQSSDIRKPASPLSSNVTTKSTDPLSTSTTIKTGTSSTNGTSTHRPVPLVPSKRPLPDSDLDMAEQINTAIQQKYIKGPKLGEGTFAVVYRGSLKSNPSHLVAIKKFKIAKERAGDGINVDTIREIKYLQELSHPSIVALYDIFSSKDQNINMVIEYFSRGNMEELIRDSDVKYGLADIKAWIGMLFRGVYFCHSRFVLHRDIKPGNLLIAENGEVKLADFGLARSFAEPGVNMTSMVVTLWYRPPELLYGAKHYGGKVDVWSCGMILAELLVRRPWCAYAPESQEQLERGGGELGQIDIINRALGTPCEEVWPGVSKLPQWPGEATPRIEAKDRGKTYFQGQFGTLDDDGVELLMKTLSLDPRKRATAKQCLADKWWQAKPRPTRTEDLPRKKNIDQKRVAEEQAKKPGVVDDKFQGVSRRLFS